MPAALPWITAGTMVYNAVKQPPMPPQPKTLSMDQARGQAQQMLNPLFDEQLQEALKRVDQSNIQRGFFGQAPGAALSRSTAADVETRRAQATGQLGAQMQGMSWDQAMQHAQLAYTAQQAQHQNLMNSLGYVQDRMPNVWDSLFTQRPTTAGVEATMNRGFLPGNLSASGMPGVQGVTMPSATASSAPAGGYMGGLQQGLGLTRTQQRPATGWLNNPYGG